MGTWHQHKAWDGHKYVCEDDFTEGEECLVYTFGVSVDASFEEAMASKGTSSGLYWHHETENGLGVSGCEVYAHDHTVKKFPNTKYENVHFVGLGIGASNTNEVKTLDTLLRDNGHTDSTVKYLKVSWSKVFFLPPLLKYQTILLKDWCRRCRAWINDAMV